MRVIVSLLVNLPWHEPVLALQSGWSFLLEGMGVPHRMRRQDSKHYMLCFMLRLHIMLQKGLTR